MEPPTTPPPIPTGLTVFADASPILRFAEDLVPGGSAIMMVVMTLSLGAVLLSLGQPSPTEAGPQPKPKRRGEECALAIWPNGSKDKGDRAWKKELTPEVYVSLRESVTDPPNLAAAEGGFDDILTEDGTFVCAGCGSALYDSDARFEAGSGWPCFFTCIQDAVRERKDNDGERYELICNMCNGHLGHIFRNEGWPSLPPPAERHCVNARSLVFVPDPEPRQRDEEDEEEEDEVEEDTRAEIRRRLEALEAPAPAEAGEMSLVFG